MKTSEKQPFTSRESLTDASDLPPGKICTKCGEYKSRVEYNRNSRRSDDMGIWCKPCHRAYCNDWRKRPEVKARIAKNALARYHALPEDEKRRRNRSHVKYEGRLRRLYGLNSDEYERLLAAQDGVCAICGVPPQVRRLAVDHDHACCPGETSCGKCVRGLLCTPCNVRVGVLENVTWVEGANAYLKRTERRDAGPQDSNL